MLLRPSLAHTRQFQGFFIFKPFRTLLAKYRGVGGSC